MSLNGKVPLPQHWPKEHSRKEAGKNESMRIRALGLYSEHDMAVVLRNPQELYLLSPRICNIQKINIPPWLKEGSLEAPPLAEELLIILKRGCLCKFFSDPAINKLPGHTPINKLTSVLMTAMNTSGSQN